MDYFATEDKAGGLHLHVFDGEECILRFPPGAGGYVLS